MTVLIVIGIFVMLTLMVGAALLMDLVEVQRQAAQIAAQRRIQDLESETIHQMLRTAMEHRSPDSDFEQ